ncbi:iron-containing alcohol dehydrogenase [Shigella flexneri]|uniref:Ethanolamine ammonia-lyase subunit EutB n=1 Tax=Shigella flexneri TaxID=623 RepID=A0A3T2UZS2_SHIFL|nr:ethanolamine ammonia-lyase subunit EutB [Shigella flexneri]EAA1151349.1 ethanolamine ammonia-lyase subunit EutB [Shigella boydii]EFC6234597.1 iron-containing alcohol dehydrogenase [Escherichia coli]EFY4738254.1 iron-containing alcohol dehydrogenase [Shigella dysenteriae]EFY6542967.1 iron-containing alcohol dehydrogenase [Shigella sonnei]
MTLCGPGSVSSCGQQAQTRGLKHLFVMADSFLHQAGMTAGLTRSLAVKGIAMTLWPCPVGEPCITDVCAAVAQLRESGCDGVIAFGGGSVLDAAKAVALLVTNPDSTLAEMSETSVLQPRLPLIAYEDDCVTRLIQDDVNETAYNQIKNWSISELREYVLSDETSVDDIAFTRKGLTSEVVAAVAKICSNADLIYGAKKMPVIKKANTTIGIPGTFSARLQPNDTRDDVQSIAAQIYEGLSFGVGDAVIGVNPVTDDVENLSRVLDTIYGVIDKFNIPTQGCVLAHVTTQIEAIRRGAPGGLIFQSICGSEKGLKEFGVELAMLDEARAVGAEFNRIAGENCLYFETGQGSALSAGANFGADQVTMEARNYGLARHYDPFIVNTVVGFIGPEYLYNDRQIIRAGLEDHFMGKLSGISMGCDCCYTNHADADQNLNENLMILLATAGCNYIMGMPLGDDIMLNYQTTAFHDTATVRQLLNLRPSPEFERWLESMGIMANGRLTKRAGDPSLFF